MKASQYKPELREEGGMWFEKDPSWGQFTRCLGDHLKGVGKGKKLKLLRVGWGMGIPR